MNLEQMDLVCIFDLQVFTRTLLQSMVHTSTLLCEMYTFQGEGVTDSVCCTHEDAGC